MTEDFAINILEQYREKPTLINEIETVEEAVWLDEALNMATKALKEKIKTGHWINGSPICPCCGEDKFKDLDADIWSDWQPKYCPNCGAKMESEKNE